MGKEAAAAATLIYAMVARGTAAVVAEHTDFEGNFSAVAFQCLQKLPSGSRSNNNKFTFNSGSYSFNYLLHAGYTFCVVTEESAGTQLPMAFLDRVKDAFMSKYGNGAAVPASGVDREFGPKLKEQMKYCMDHPEEISKFAKVKAQVSEVKGIMMDNIDKVLDRGEKIEILVDKSENLSNQAQDFRSTGGQLRRKMWIQNMKVKLIVLGILIALILIIVLSVCRGFSC